MQTKALQSTADLLMFDLEDSVALTEKEGPSSNHHHPAGPTRTPSSFGSALQRIGDRLVHRDVIEILEAAVDRVSVLVIPKVENAGDVACFSRLLNGIERHTKAQQTIRLCLHRKPCGGTVEAIATASPRLEALVFGIADYSRAIGSPLVSSQGMEKTRNRFIRAIAGTTS